MAYLGTSVALALNKPLLLPTYMYMYMYTCTHIYVYICIHTHTYIICIYKALRAELGLRATPTPGEVPEGARPARSSEHMCCSFMSMSMSMSTFIAASKSLALLRSYGSCQLGRVCS